MRHFRKLLVDGIERLQHHVHQLGSHLALAVAQHIEQVLGHMATLHHGIELEKPSPTLDGMKTTENRVEQISVVGALLQLDQLLGELLQYFACFDQEVLENFFVVTEPHSALLSNLSHRLLSSGGRPWLTTLARIAPAGEPCSDPGQKPRLDSKSSTSS